MLGIQAYFGSPCSGDEPERAFGEGGGRRNGHDDEGKLIQARLMVPVRERVYRSIQTVKEP